MADKPSPETDDEQAQRGDNRPDGTVEPAETPGSSSDGLVVVGVGASAGGLEAFKQLLRAVPEDSGLAFVLIQHLAPDHDSMMAELLSPHTSIQVVQVEDGMALEADRAYMIPPNHALTVREGTLHLEPPVETRGVRMPIDHFFASLAEDRGERAAAVLLSGTGSDGTLGIREIKARGGIVVAQEPGTAEHGGMPRSAIATGLVDFTLPVEEIPDLVIDYARHPYVEADSAGGGVAEDTPDKFGSILSLLRTYTEFDFASYKPGTLSRRIHRRMGLRRIDRAEDYLDLLREDPRERQALFDDLMISVTRFFREPEAWKTLAEDVLAPLLESKAATEPVRAWVPGCATGEEAYTLAMLLFEQRERCGSSNPLQIFATDMSRGAINVARAGRYPATIAADLIPERVDRFFDAEETYRVDKRLREVTVFAPHDLLNDPPFSNLDLICCRNVLIYLTSPVQERVLELFHFALRDDGHLFLGTAEGVGPDHGLFEPVSKRWRIYRRLDGDRARPGMEPFVTDRRTTPFVPRGRRREPVAEAARRALLDRFAPASVVVDRRGRVVYFHGPLRHYLDFPHGEPTRELASMALPGLGPKLRALVRQVRESDTAALGVASRVLRDDNEVPVRIGVEPLTATRDHEGLLLVTLEDLEVPEAAEIPAADLSDEEREIVERLESELDVTREDLQSTIAELEASNQELNASNEEVMSMNEELQSTNQELETSREELQSLNEELETVNRQLEDKVQQLEAANDDLTNLLTSTEIATLFLDPELRIRRFTPAAGDLLNIIDSDVGRPIHHLAPEVNDPELMEDAGRVFEEAEAAAREVRTDDGRWFIRRVLPYRTQTGHVTGVVVTFTDITPQKITARRLQQREAQQAAVASLGNRALSAETLQELLDATARVVADTLDVEFCKILELQRDDEGLLLRAGVGWKDGAVGSVTLDAGLDSQAGYALHSRGPVIVEDLESETRFRDARLLREHRIVCGLSVLVGTLDEPWGVIGAHSDSRQEFTDDDIHFLESVAHVLWASIQQRREATERRRAAAELERADRMKDEFLALLGHELRNPLGAITATLAMIRHTDSEQKRADGLSVIERQAAQLGRLLDDLLDVSRITRGDIEIRPRRVNLREVVGSALETVPDLEDRDFHVDVPGEIWLQADAARLEQVVSNLLRNAVRYSDAGDPIRLRARQRDGRVQIDVHDEGIGMTEETLDVIFEPFVHPAAEAGSERTGLGVGLTLVRKLVQLHDGSISASSPGPGEGSTFHLELPAAGPPEEEGNSVPDTDPEDRRANGELKVLIVDDNRDLAESLTWILEHHGYEVRAEHDGSSGIAATDEWAPDAILLDIGLPDIDGYEAGAKIRGKRGRDVWIAAISGFKPEETDEGDPFDGYFIKPVDHEDVVAELRQLAGARAPDRVDEAPDRVDEAPDRSPTEE